MTSHLPLSLRAHAALAVALVASSAFSSGPTKAASSTSSVAMGVPSVLSGATLVSHVATSKVLCMTISLAPSNRAAFQAYADAVSDPKSPDYHHFLSPSQVGQRFGASASTVSAVTAYLKSKNLTATLVGDSHLAVVFKGSVSNVEAAFGTKINNYKVASRTTPGPLQFFSYATTPKVPTAFASSVVTIQGLDNANPPVSRTSALRPQDARSVYDTVPLYGASDIGGHKGEGVNIGITNFSGYRISTVGIYGNAFGLPQPTGGYGSNVHKKIVGGVDGETVAEGGEGDLDFQMVLAIAPKADVYIYDGIGGGLIATLAQEAQDNVVDIVSESYGFGGGDDFYLAAHDQHLAMTVQGITYMGASGDSGTADMRNDPYPDFDPDVLMVGGSDVTLDSSGGRGTEAGWNGSGSGWYTGDISFNVLPPYQKGTTVPTSPNRRLVPDLALHATNWFFAFNGAIGGVGGTSAASPSFAGQLGVILQSLREQDAVDPASNGRPRLGRIQDFIYGLDGDSNVFLDLLGGDAGKLPDGTESVGKTGWDFVTGWGAPDDFGLYNAYLAASSVAIVDRAQTTDVYVIPSPSLVLGTNPSGDATSLTDVDGSTYSLRSVRQAGVGQVAAAEIGITLQTEKARRSASLSIAMQSPELTTDYVFLFNKITSVYDVVKTVPGSGSMTTVTVPLDVSATNPYLGDDGSMKLLVRALKPARFGNTPFVFTVDKVTAIEKVARG